VQLLIAERRNGIDPRRATVVNVSAAKRFVEASPALTQTAGLLREPPRISSAGNARSMPLQKSV
jgi:hypothetical protein